MPIAHAVQKDWEIVIKNFKIMKEKSFIRLKWVVGTDGNNYLN